MKYAPIKVLVVLIAIILMISACATAQNPVSAEKEQPAVVEPVEGSEFSRVMLTERAVERLDIQTAPVSVEQMDGTQYKIIPYAAVLYGLDGETWVYTTNPKSHTYLRQTIIIDHIDGDLAYVTEGPEVDTPVVTLGASLLYGAEVGVSK